MVFRAKHVVALLDHSKFNTNSISSFASLKDINTIITDKKIDAQTTECILKNDIHVIDQ